MAAPPGAGSEGNPRTKAKGPAWMGTAAGRGPVRREPNWKPSAKKQYDPEARQRAIRALVATLAALLLAGFVYYLLTRPQPTPLVALRVTAYPLTMPPLAFAQDDVELLSKVSPRNVQVMSVDFESSDSLDDFRKQLKAAGRQFNPFRRGSDAIVVHVTAHGTLNEQGTPCLVPPAANPFDSQTWLPLAKVFEAIRQEPALKTKKKLVLLDCQRVISCWRCGWLECRFADELAAAVKGESDPTLYVIAAAAPGQIAWAAPELRGSVFGHFLARAMKGEAADSRSALSLVDLFRYVAREVDAYSQLRRGVPQQPTLWHGGTTFVADESGRLVSTAGAAAKADDFTLAYIDRGQKRRKLQDFQSSTDPLNDAKRLLGSPTDAAAADGISTSYTLHQVWQRYRQRRQAATNTSDASPTLPGYVYDPVAWSSIQQRLAAIGERLLAGKQYQGAALQAEIDRLGKDLDDEQQWTTQGVVPSLDQPQALLARRGSGRAKASAGGNVFDTYWKTEPDKRSEALPRGVPRQRLVQDIYQALADSSRGADARENLTRAAELLKLVPRSDARIDLIEGHFVTLLDRGLPAGEPISSSQLATALRLRQAAEEAANPLDHRVHYGVESLVSAADEKRRQAEDLLYLGGDARRFDSLAGEAQGDGGRTTGYQGALQVGRNLSEYLRLRDEVWADLPLLAEWHFIRGRFGAAPTSSQSASPLQTLCERSIALDDSVERALRSRDEAGTFAQRYANCGQAYEALSQAWRKARAELEEVYALPTNIERAYRRAPDVRDAELALRFPPLAGSSNQFLERYQQTLVEWIQPESDPDAAGRANKSGNRSSTNDGEPSSITTAEAGSLASAPAQYAFLRELHRALAYEFVDPYEQHRHATQWDEKQDADLVFRSADALQESAWNRLRVLLDRYNEAIAKQSPAWSSTQSSLSAAATLRQWDRRVRVAASWLCSFQADLRRPNQPTPARWLQQYDAAHFTVWQAYRVKGDFWGNGVAGSAAAPFFAEAIEQCEAALPERMRPIQYDLPGGGSADFDEERPTALAALRQWDPIQFPRSLNVSSTSSADTKIDVSIQPPAEAGQELKLPPGTATLSIAAADGEGGGPRAAFDSAGEGRKQAVVVPLAAAATTFTAHLDRQGGASGAALEARLWYRGHVRAKPCPADNAPPFVKYEFNRPNYAPPTVEVRGKDVLRGAVLFIFDCSSSMRDADGRFAEAKRQLQQVLDQLADDAGAGLRVGLVAYGKRTKAFGSEDDPDLFYRFRSHPDRTPQLTRAGEAMKERLGNRFFEAYPHPDRDVEELVRVAEGTPALAKAKLNEMREAQCVGCTPLYYTIAQALQSGFRGLSDQTPGSRQIVVISDGVNMPYNCAYDQRTRNYSVGQTGANVNNDDYAALERALDASQGSVRVTVHLFGAPGTDFEREQYLTLKRLDGRFDALDVVNLPNAARIKESILNSFPKSTIELRAPSSGAATQQLAFNQPSEVKEWGNDGLLRRDAERRSLRVKLPGEERSLQQELELLGGERVVLLYNSRDAQLSFDKDEWTHRGSKPVQGPRGSDSRKLLFDVLDPERIGTTINRFHFRIRDEDWEHRFTPRPRYVWVELKPRVGGADTADLIFPCIDAVWKENVNLPRLQVPVDRWPECPTARVQAWFRFADPVALHQATITRDQSGQTLALAPDKWRVEQTGGEAGAARTITVTWQPSDPQAGIDKLLERAVWLWPPPDVTRRFYALDGSAAIHEFTYSRPEAVNLDLQLRVVSKSQFQQGAYFAEGEFDVAN